MYKTNPGTFLNKPDLVGTFTDDLEDLREVYLDILIDSIFFICNSVEHTLPDLYMNVFIDKCKYITVPSCYYPRYKDTSDRNKSLTSKLCTSIMESRYT